MEGGGTPEIIQLKYETILDDLGEGILSASADGCMCSKQLPGDLIFINDGVIRLVVDSKEEKHLNCTVQAGTSPSSPSASHLRFQEV